MKCTSDHESDVKISINLSFEFILYTFVLKLETACIFCIKKHLWVYRLISFKFTGLLVQGKVVLTDGV